jgi:DNA-binding NarL/FixJ family response regulator
MRILIADDNDVVRRGVIEILSSEKDWEVCGEAKDGSEALRKAQELLPDLILLDISMPGMDGLEAARLLRHEVPKAKIVVISQHDPIQLLPCVIEAGANGCVDKSRLSTDLLASIKKIACAEAHNPKRWP